MKPNQLQARFKPTLLAFSSLKRFFNFVPRQRQVRISSGHVDLHVLQRLRTPLFNVQVDGEIRNRIGVDFVQAAVTD
jgi:hypothetical protein